MDRKYRIAVGYLLLNELREPSPLIHEGLTVSAGPRFFLERYEMTVQPSTSGVTILLSSCGTFIGFTASLSLGKVR